MRLCRGCDEKKSALAQMHTGEAAILLQRERPQGQRGAKEKTTREANMANLDLFDKRGRFTPPSDEALAALDDASRTRVADIGNAARALDAATDAIANNESALTETRAEIAKLEKLVPKQTFNDLIKQQCAETARRRMGR
jgi:hypothetical protein